MTVLESFHPKGILQPNIYVLLFMTLCVLQDSLLPTIAKRIKYFKMCIVKYFKMCIVYVVYFLKSTVNLSNWWSWLTLQVILLSEPNDIRVDPWLNRLLYKSFNTFITVVIKTIFEFKIKRARRYNTKQLVLRTNNFANMLLQ